MWVVRAYEFPYLARGRDFEAVSFRLALRIVRGMSGPKVGLWSVSKCRLRYIPPPPSQSNRRGRPRTGYANTPALYEAEITDGHFRRTIEFHGRWEARA